MDYLENLLKQAGADHLMSFELKETLVEHAAGNLRVLKTWEPFKGYPLYSQDETDDPIVINKLFDPTSGATWYLTEYDPKEKIAFGFVTGLHENELGYISLAEIESIKGPLGIGIEQDLYFVQKLLYESGNK